MPERAPLTDEDLLHYIEAGLSPEKIAKLYHLPITRVEKQIDRLARETATRIEAERRRLQRATSNRPFPPEALCAPSNTPCFEPAAPLLEWTQETFIRRDGLLRNDEHSHLSLATVGIVWTNVDNNRQGRFVAGQAEMPRAQGGKWAIARGDFQMYQWFGCVPDFLITLHAGYCAQADDASFCALIEHELYHCAQARDMFGCPRFNKDGEPIFGMRGHDVEEFIGVVARYGIGAASSQVGAFVTAAGKPPMIGPARIAEACGTCLKAA